MKVYTIGFTKRSAEDFFGTLRRAGIGRLIDVRLNNTSQLAAFAKRDDLAFFLREICAADYVHEPLLAPSEEMLKTYRDGRDWDRYTCAYQELLAERRVEDALDPRTFDGQSVLLCSELTAERCHRRLALEYLRDAGGPWAGMEIVHL